MLEKQKQTAKADNPSSESKAETPKQHSPVPAPVPAHTKQDTISAQTESTNTQPENEYTGKMETVWQFIIDPKHSGAVIAIFTILIFITGAIYAVFAALRWSAIRDGNQIARDTFNAANRPFVGVDGIDLFPTEDPAHKGGPGARIDVHVKNFGPTPGTNLMLFWTVIIDGEPRPGAVLQREILNPRGLPSTIFPTETRHMILVTTESDYSHVFVEHTSILDLDISISYDGPSGHYVDCTRHRYYFVDESFMNLGPRCQARPGTPRQ